MNGPRVARAATCCFCFCSCYHSCEERHAYQSCRVRRHSIPETIGQAIETACSTIYPLQDVFIRKVKMLKKPKFDLTKLLEMHSEAAAAEAGAKVARVEEGVVENTAGAGGRY